MEIEVLDYTGWQNFAISDVAAATASSAAQHRAIVRLGLPTF